MTLFSKISKGIIAAGLGLMPIYYASAQLHNPLGFNNIDQLLTNIIKWITGIVGLVALLALVYGGLQLILALGNEKKVASAKAIIFWAIAGIIVVTLAYTIIYTLAFEVLKVT